MLYDLTANSLFHEAVGESLLYRQLYPFEGLQNYSSRSVHAGLSRSRAQG
jgi:hypothetical protein